MCVYGASESTARAKKKKRQRQDRQQKDTGDRKRGLCSRRRNPGASYIASYITLHYITSSPTANDKRYIPPQGYYILSAHSPRPTINNNQKPYVARFWYFRILLILFFYTAQPWKLRRPGIPWKSWKLSSLLILPLLPVHRPSLGLCLNLSPPSSSTPGHQSPATRARPRLMFPA